MKDYDAHMDATYGPEDHTVEDALRWTMEPGAELAGVQKEDLAAITDLLVTEWKSQPQFVLSMDDAFGWTSTGSPVVMAEDGPDEWALNLPTSVREYAEERELHLEAVNTWVISVTPR